MAGSELAVGAQVPGAAPQEAAAVRGGPGRLVAGWLHDRVHARAGMTMFRMPIFVWNVLLTAVLVLPAFPVLAAALLCLEADRKFGAHVFEAANGGPLLWQHLFWFFGHPEVYIIALPFFGIISEVIPVFSRKPIFGYLGLVGATIAIAGLSATVWAHHMHVTGGVLLPFFSFMTLLIAVPTGVKFFNWIGTMWCGSPSFETPMLWATGFLVTFLLGGLTGAVLASPPRDFHVSDSYFVVAHFPYVVFGTVVFAMFSGFPFWWPKWTGRMLDERLPWLTTAQAEEVRRVHVHDHLDHAREVLRATAERCEQLRAQYRAAHLALRRRTTACAALGVAAAAALMAVLASLRQAPHRPCGRGTAGPRTRSGPDPAGMKRTVTG